MGALKESFEEFRRETRGNFDRANGELDKIRYEMHEGFREDRIRLDSLEATRDTAKGSLGFGQWMLVSLGPLSAALGWLLGNKG